MITVIGLGVERGDLSRKGEEKIIEGAKAGRKIVVRTAGTVSYQTVLDLGVGHICLDSVYERSRSFSSLAKNLASAVLAAGEDPIYLVDGAATEDNSVKVLIKRLAKGKLEIIDGVSRVTALVRTAGFAGCSYTAISAYELAERCRAGSISLPVIVYDLDDRGLASDCKLLLGNLFGEESEVKFLCQGRAKKISLYELDRQKSYDYTTAAGIEEIPLLDKQRFCLDDLKEIIHRLRAPNGCPWDRVQTSESIKMSAVE